MAKRHSEPRKFSRMSAFLYRFRWSVFGRIRRRRWRRNRRHRRGLHLRRMRRHERFRPRRRRPRLPRPPRYGRRQARIQRRSIRQVPRRTVGRRARVRHRTRRRPPVDGVKARGFRRPAGDRAVVGKPREADARIRPNVHPGAPSGVGHQVAHREVLADVRQRTAAGRSAGSTLGAVDGQVVRIPVHVVTEQKAGVTDQRLSVVTGDGFDQIVQAEISADQQAGEFRVVFHQQPRRRLEHVDRVDEVVPWPGR